MNITKLFLVCGLTAAASLLASCKNESPKTAPTSKSGLPAATAAGGLTIAYIEVDSILTQYTFAKEQMLVLEKNQQGYQSRIAAKSRELENAMQAFYQKAQAGEYTEETGKRAQTALQKQQSDLEELQARLAEKAQNEMLTFNETVRDSLQNFLKDFNKDNKYALILAKQGDNILQADASMNITDAVISGLNKRYQARKK